MFFLQLKKEILLHWRERHHCWRPLFFFILVCLLFPLATSSDSQLLQKIAPGVILVASLLATLLALPHLFEQDFADGSLDQYFFNEFPLSFVVLAKIIAQWLVFVLPLLIITPIVALMFGLTQQTIFMLILSMLLATPILYFIGAVVAALTVGLPRSSLLLTILLIPLYIPTLIFSAGGVILVAQQPSAFGPCALLAGLSLICLLIAPYLTAQALRLGVAGR